LIGERVVFHLRCNADASAIARVFPRGAARELLDHHWLIARWSRMDAPATRMEWHRLWRACDSNALSRLNFCGRAARINAPEEARIAG
jgi:hypothetical protein